MTALSIGDGRPMPQDGALQIALNRYLLPASVSRASVQLRQANGELVTGAQAPNVVYDPIARTVTLIRPRPGPWLEPGQAYRLVLPIAGAPEDAGLRAIDGTPLSSAQPRQYVFFVDAAPPPAPRTLQATLGEPDSVSFCDDVLPLLVRKCGAGTCHGTSPRGSAAGLVLDRADGIRATAINKVAHGATVGGAPGSLVSEGPVFGVDMPIISVDERVSPPVGVPGNSWLVYKVEIARLPVVDAGEAGAASPFACTGRKDVTPAQATPFVGLVPAAPADDLQRTLLGDLVAGREMPYPPLSGSAPAYATQPLTFQEREKLRMWIARGAPTPDCGACSEP